MNTRTTIVVLLLLTLNGCGDGGTPPNSPPAPNPPAAPARAQEPVRVYPEWTVTIKTGEGDANPSIVNWTAKVPTGGWTVTTDSTLVEDVLGKLSAKIYVTVEQPHPDEAVTQDGTTTHAVEALSGELKDARKIERAEFWVRTVVRNYDDVKRAMYAQVKNVNPYN